MQKACESCSNSFEATKNTARFCSDRCRKRAARRLNNVSFLSPKTPDLAPENGPETASVSTLLGQIKQTLTDSGVLDTPNGQLAIRLAARIENQGNDSGSSIAALSKELRLVMAEVMNRVVAADDPIDELQRRRESRRRA